MEGIIFTALIGLAIIIGVGLAEVVCFLMQIKDELQRINKIFDGDEN